MKIAVKSAFARIASIVLIIIIGVSFIFDSLSVVANAAELNYTSENESTLTTDYYYDKDDCDYTANSSTLHFLMGGFRYSYP